MHEYMSVSILYANSILRCERTSMSLFYTFSVLCVLLPIYLLKFSYIPIHAKHISWCRHLETQSCATCKTHFMVPSSCRRRMMMSSAYTAIISSLQSWAWGRSGRMWASAWIGGSILETMCLLLIADIFYTSYTLADLTGGLEFSTWHVPDPTGSKAVTWERN